MKQFEFLEHTADIKLRIYGKDLKQLFKNAAQGMMHYLFDDDFSAKVSYEERLHVTAEDLTSLLVNWLSELLYLSAVQHRVYHKFKINEITDSKVDAVVYSDEAIAHADIKAVTYHDVKMERNKEGWLAEVVFDI